MNEKGDVNFKLAFILSYRSFMSPARLVAQLCELYPFLPLLLPYYYYYVHYYYYYYYYYNNYYYLYLLRINLK